MDYPLTLPNPDHVSYSGSYDLGLLQTSVPSAQGNQIASFNAAREPISLTYSMDNATYKLWKSFAETDGWKWFDAQLVTTNTPVKITSKQTVRYTGGFSYQKRGHNWGSVTVAAELLPAQATDPLA